MKEEKFDIEIFSGKTFGDLLKEIHQNTEDNRNMIEGLITDFKENSELNSLGDVKFLAETLQPYVKMTIDNNEHIIKMASIVQKAVEKPKATNSSEENLSFSKEELDQLEQLALEYQGKVIELPPPAANEKEPIKAKKKVKNE